MSVPLSTVTFPCGSACERTSVSAITQHGGDYVVIAASTPFHPRDYQWPDQPEDGGYIESSAGRRHGLSDVVCVGVDSEGIYFVDTEIPVKKNAPGWQFVVGHVIRGENPSLAAGDEILLQVDEARRSQLSRPHSAAHLMSLALDRVLAPLWHKEAPWLDALNNPPFDQLAIERSQIAPLSSVDSYRLGKSLRKKGFSAHGLANELDESIRAVNAQIAEWLQTDAPVSIRTEGNLLTSYRYWSTVLENRTVEIPCGGTAVARLCEIGSVEVTAEMPDEETLIIRTSVR